MLKTFTCWSPSPPFFKSLTQTFCFYLKENQNAPRPSEHPLVRGGEMAKRLGGIKGCKYKKPLDGI